MSDAHRVRLLRAIRTSDHLLDDDELSQRAGIKPRQAVNQVLRRLEREGVVRRRPGPSGKIVTELQHEIGSVASFPADAVTTDGTDARAARLAIDRTVGHERPAGSSFEQREAERVMLDLLGQRIGRPLEPARITLTSGTRVEIDGADEERSVLVECWAHQGPPKGGQRHKVLADALKLTWIASTLYPRPELVLCMSDPLASAPFQPTSTSWAARALQDLGIQIELIELPVETRIAVTAAQARQYR